MLTRRQMQLYADFVGKRMRDMARARDRLEKRGEHLDEIYKLTVAAENALHSLRIAALYQSVDGVAQLNDRPK